MLGDSTAAGAGLPGLRRASAADRICGRSTGSYARDLAVANGWRVTNLACDSATIQSGLLGPQLRRGRRLPPQIDSAVHTGRRGPAAGAGRGSQTAGGAGRDGGANLIIVSVGADDVGWSGQVVSCALRPGCGGAAAAAGFRRQLAAFSGQYQALLARLAALPGRPLVLVNEYYDPFGSAPDCLAVLGIRPASVRTLRQRLADLNAVLADGARRAGFLAVRPSIAGHELCDRQSWVQGLLSPAPFHPTAAGEWAIARADTAAVRGRL